MTALQEQELVEALKVIANFTKAVASELKALRATVESIGLMLSKKRN